MSVVEVYAIRVSGFVEGFLAAQKLAARTGAVLRWAAAWLDPREPAHREKHAAIARCFGARLVATGPVDHEMLTACVASPTSSEAHDLVAHAASLPVVFHFSPPLYEGEEGEGADATWISFIDHAGHHRDDARVYRIELAGDAAPLTVADRPGMSGFGYGPALATGWHLHLVAIRDHMPRSELVRWLAEAADVPLDTIGSPP